jgi:hypothetical protein
MFLTLSTMEFIAGACGCGCWALASEFSSIIALRSIASRPTKRIPENMIEFLVIVVK